mgnify:CR=1 FL=1
MIPTLKEAVRLAPYTSFNEFNWSQNRPTKNLEGNKMKNAETNDKKFDEFLTACVVKQVKAQGFVPLEVTGVDIGKLELDMQNGTYGELPSFLCFANPGCPTMKNI